jgi:hypothetical protein
MVAEPELIDGRQRRDTGSAHILPNLLVGALAALRVIMIGSASAIKAAFSNDPAAVHVCLCICPPV